MNIFHTCMLTERIILQENNVFAREEPLANPSLILPSTTIRYIQGIGTKAAHPPMLNE